MLGDGALGLDETLAPQLHDPIVLFVVHIDGRLVFPPGRQRDLDLDLASSRIPVVFLRMARVDVLTMMVAVEHRHLVGHMLVNRGRSSSRKVRVGEHMSGRGTRVGESRRRVVHEGERSVRVREN